LKTINQHYFVKTTERLLLGIFLGALCGVALASMILKLPAVRQIVGDYAFDFEIAFGRSIGENIFSVLKIMGVLAGASVGGSLAVSIRWFAALGTLLVGIVIGGATMFFVEARVVKYVSGIWEQGSSDERASTYLEALRVLDRGATNQFYVTRFQTVGRSVLSNYLHETEERMQNFQNRKHTDFLFTNSATYHIVQKYLATHTNSLPIGSDF